MSKSKEDVKITITPVFECKHYNREEINFSLDGKIPPRIRCKDCGKILE